MATMECVECGRRWTSEELREIAEFNDYQYRVLWEDFKRRGCAAVDEEHSERDPTVAMLGEMYGEGFDPDEFEY